MRGLQNGLVVHRHLCQLLGHVEEELLVPRSQALLDGAHLGRILEVVGECLGKLLPVREEYKRSVVFDERKICIPAGMVLVLLVKTQNRDGTRFYGLVDAIRVGVVS